VIIRIRLQQHRKLFPGLLAGRKLAHTAAMLHLLSYFVGFLTLIGLITCIALGLLKLCDYIEASSTRARKIGLRLSQSMAVLGTLLTFTDRLPYLFLMTNWASNASSLYALKDRQWPATASSKSLLLPLLSSLLAHSILVHHFHQSAIPPTLKNGNKTLWPGGRQDWDIKEPAESVWREYGNGEALTCLAICWLPALWITLGAIAQNWALPHHTKQSDHSIKVKS
jgi:hypothetical protein